MRDMVIAAGFQALRVGGLDHLLSSWTQGLGAILMFHHVRPARAVSADYAPNQLLDITPEFFEEVMAALVRQGYEVITLDEGLLRLSRPKIRGQAPFAVLTFDDGYRDNRDFALPIMQRYGFPFTMYVTTGFADRTARMWWRELELAIASTPALEVRIDGTVMHVASGTGAEKSIAFKTIYGALRGGPEERLLDVIGELCERYAIDGKAIVEDVCLDTAEIVAMTHEPLCNIGVHTCTHPMLAKHTTDFVHRELAESKEALELLCGSERRHLAYPVGDPTSAGVREFAMARDLGFASAVTTRPGMLFPAHAAHTTALPRLSVNGCWQSVRHVESLLSGAPFALWNKGRRLNVA